MENTNNTKENNPNENKAVENKKQTVFEIPAEGSLGILALGAVGIKAWRKKRDELKNNEKK